MSAAQQGSKIESYLQNAEYLARAGVQTNDQPDGQGAQGGARATEYPRRFETRNNYDEIMRMKQELMQGREDGMTPMGQVMATDRDFRWLEQKQKMQELANFDAWFGKHFNKNDVATRAIAQELYPTYYQEREKLMVERAKLALRVKLIALRGPKSEEDLMVMYGLNTGVLKLDEGWDQIGFNWDERNEAGQRARFNQGLFSLDRLVSNDAAANNYRVDRALGAPFTEDERSDRFSVNSGWESLLSMLG